MTEKTPLQTLIDLGNKLISDISYARSVWQAEPVIYGVLCRQYLPAPEGYEEGYAIVSNDYTETLSYNPLDYLMKYLRGEDWFDDYYDKSELDSRYENAHSILFPYQKEWIPVNEFPEKLKYSQHDVIKCIEELEIGHPCPYQTTDYLKDDVLALTHEGIQEYLQLNGHNLPKDAHSFAMTASRVPEIRDLKKALKDLSRDTALPVGICPNCKKPTNYDLDIIEHDNDPNIYKICTCHECNTTWHETYSHVKTEIFNQGDTECLP